MDKKIASIFIFLLCFFTSYAQIDALKVMSYNVRSFEPDFDVTQHIALIKSENPDVVAFQEVENRTSRVGRIDLIVKIGAATGMFPLFAPAYDKEIGAYGVAILSKYPILSSAFFALPRLQEEGAADPRVALVADIILPNNQKLRIVNTHLDHLFGNGSIQLTQSKQLTGSNILDAHTPVVLLGDFNQWPQDNAITYLKGFFDRQCSDAYTFQNGYKLDYIFTYPRSKWQRISYNVLHNISLSDHYPLVATISYLP